MNYYEAQEKLKGMKLSTDCKHLHHGEHCYIKSEYGTSYMQGDIYTIRYEKCTNEDGTCGDWETIPKPLGRKLLLFFWAIIWS